MAAEDSLMKQTLRTTLLMLVPMALFLAVLSVITVALRPASKGASPSVQARSLGENTAAGPATDKPRTGKLPAEI